MRMRTVLLLLGLALLLPGLTCRPAWAVGLSLEAGEGRVVALPAPVANIFVADPKVAEARPASTSSLFVFGVGPGRTTVAALDADGKPVVQIQVTVRPSGFAAREAAAALSRLIPGGHVRVAQEANGLLLSGSVPTAAGAARAVAVAKGFVPAGQTVQNEISVQGATQVMLEVRIAEMSRSVTRALGVNWQALGTFGQIGKLPALNAMLNGASPVACLAPLLSVACKGANLNALIDALSTDGLVHVLAEPNLTVASGQSASFLVGGEFPIPVAQQNNQVTIAFKRYGVRLSFLPTVLEDGRIDLHVSPEVSQLTSQGSVQLGVGNSTISVPALTVRRAQTTVELGSGESFAIAGLLEDSVDDTGKAVPVLGDTPIIAPLFRDDTLQRNQIELVILITPLIVRPVADPAALRVPGATYRVPSDFDRLLMLRQVARPDPALPHHVPGDAGFIEQ